MSFISDLCIVRSNRLVCFVIVLHNYLFYFFEDHDGNTVTVKYKPYTGVINNVFTLRTNAVPYREIGIQGV